MQVKTFAGVDVGLKELVVCRWRDRRAEEKRVANDVGGHADLIRWLGKRSRVCLEATGVYHLQVALALRKAGVEVMVINPRVAKDFTRALSNRSKTHCVDASALLEYVMRMEFQPWEAPRPAVLELRELGRRLGEFVHSLVMEK